MPEINIQPEYLEEIKAILNRYVPDAEVWAYGSRVGGSCHEGTDLDLVLRNSSDLGAPIREIGAVKEAIGESNVPFLVDVLDWARLPRSFQEEIEKNYMVIEGRDED
jgi:predicted nucleotidyltransferase